MNNKKIGTAWEKECCKILRDMGYWVHFIVPDARGAQPFDIVAVKDGKALAIDCKTCVADTFTMARLEDNQKMSFEHWLKCGNEMPLILIKHNDSVYCVPYHTLKKSRNGRVKLKEKFLIMERSN